MSTPLVGFRGEKALEKLSVSSPRGGNCIPPPAGGGGSCSLCSHLFSPVCGGPADAPAVTRSGAAVHVCSVPRTDRAAGPMKSLDILRMSNQSKRGGARYVVVGMTSCTNSWSLADNQKKCRPAERLRPAAGLEPPSQRVLLLTMLQLERLGSGCSPPRLLLLIYTFFCAVGGEWTCLFVCAAAAALIRGAVPFVGGAEILLRGAAGQAAAGALHPGSGLVV